jgi:hypothetical protein
MFPKLQGRPCETMLERCSLRELIMAFSFGNFALITYREGYE